MLTDITPRKPVEIKEREIEFLRDAASGFGFPCDAEGKLLPELSPEAKANYAYCMAHPEEFPYAWNEMRVHARRYVEPASGLCSCGERVTLHGSYMGADQCPGCGRWYNVYGQELLPPEQWEDQEDY